MKDAETLKFDKKNFITEIGKKTKNYKNIQGQYIGLIKIRKEITKNVLDTWNLLRKLQNKKKVKNMYFTDFLTTLIKKKNQIKSCIHQERMVRV